MKIINIKTILFVLCCVLISCRKEIKKTTSSKDLSELIDEDRLYHSKQKNIIPTGEETILGEKIINPNKISFLMEYTKMMGVNIPKEKLTPTHIYIKFLPENENDVITLMKKMDEDGSFILEKIPFHYKVEQYGEKFTNPEAKKGEISPLYTTVKVGYNLPKVKYEILDSMILPESRTDLTPQEELAIRSAELIGMALNGDIELNEDYIDALADSLGIDISNIDFSEEEQKGRFFNRIVRAIKKIIKVVSFVVQKSLHYVQKFIEIFIPSRKLRGTINVENNLTNRHDPLNGMRIQIRKAFVFYNVNTDANGNFETPEGCPLDFNYDIFLGNEDNLGNKIHSGFTEQIDRFEDLTSSFLNIFTPINRIGFIKSQNNGEPQNTITVTGGGFFSKQLWNKATVCNAIKEYNKVAKENDIKEYKNGKIWLTAIGGGGMAGMFHEMSGLNLFTQLEYNIIFSGYGLFLSIMLYSDILPDIIVQRSNYSRSIYSLVFHELTHYSHALDHKDKYTFWGKVSVGEGMNIITKGGNPYSNGNSPDIEKANAIGLAESWANFMASYIMYMYRQKNNPNRYNNYIQNKNLYDIYTEDDEYINIEEYRLRQIPSKYSKNYDSWFPTGMYHDMIDNVRDTVRLMNDGNIIVDEYIEEVKGFTVKNMYKWMTECHSVECFMEKAIQTVPEDGYYFNYEAFNKDIEPHKRVFVSVCDDFINYFESLLSRKRDYCKKMICDGELEVISVIPDIIDILIYMKVGSLENLNNSYYDILYKINIANIGYDINDLKIAIDNYTREYYKIKSYYDNNKIHSTPKTDLRNLFRVYNTRR